MISLFLALVLSWQQVRRLRWFGSTPGHHGTFELVASSKVGPVVFEAVGSPGNFKVDQIGTTGAEGTPRADRMT